MFDDAMIELPCPDCGHKTPKTIGWAKRNNDLVCAGCDETIAVDNRQLVREFRRVDEAMADFKKSIHRLNKKP